MLGRWGDNGDLPLVLNVIRYLYAHAEKEGSGLVPYLGIRSYPAVLVFTAYGLGLTRAERWGALHRLFDAVIHREYKEPVRAIECLFLWAWKGTEREIWKQIEGLEQHKTPLSEHLLVLFSEWGKRFNGVTPDFGLMFERFEMLGSLAYLERNSKADVPQELAAGDPQQAWVRMPVGRSGWNSGNADTLVAEFQTEMTKASLIKSGFAQGDLEYLDLFIQNFRRIAGRMRW